MTRILETSVCIIGSGPAGLLLSQLLAYAGIDSILLDRQDRDHIEGRIRAGVLEQGTVDALVDAGVGDRLVREGLLHSGFELAFDGERHRIDIEGLTGKTAMVYGQTEVTKDLFARRAADGASFYLGVDDVVPTDLKADRPCVNFTLDCQRMRVNCDYIAGCDGFRGVSRNAIPAEVLRTYERIYPFGWLGILTEQAPVSHELIYANHDRGFALCSMRIEHAKPLLRAMRCGRRYRRMVRRSVLGGTRPSHRPEYAADLQTGPSIEKSIAPLRSFVTEPMRWGDMFLCGDAAHIVPPTGAKGLNTAVADVRILYTRADRTLRERQHEVSDAYSETVLARVWKVERFSWWLSTLMHQFPDHSPFELKMQRAEFEYIRQSEAASRAMAENYVGLPLYA